MPTLVALLIDREEDRTLRPVLVVIYRNGTELPDNGCIASSLSNGLHVAAAVVA